MTDPVRDLAQLLGDLAVDMQDQVDTESTLHAMVNGAVAIVPGTQWAGISLIHGGKIDSRAPSDPVVAELDCLQSELDEGPCLSALREHRTILIDDMATETRWPRFTAEAVKLGARSMLAFQLSVVQQNLGALNLYGGAGGVFSDDSLHIGEIVAQHASVALFGAAAETQLGSALLTRDIIGQAKGVIMERFKIDATAAFLLLTKLSQESNVTIVAIAHKFIESLAFPTLPEST